MNAVKCAACGRELTADERGLSCKLINRATPTMYCMDCLGRMFRMSPEQLRALIDRLRAAGCTLFP